MKMFVIYSKVKLKRDEGVILYPLVHSPVATTAKTRLDQGGVPGHCQRGTWGTACSSPSGWQTPKHLNYHLLPARHIDKGLNQKQRSLGLNRCCDMGRQYCKQCLFF